MIAHLQTAVSNVPSRKARLKGLSQVESVKIKVERAALLFRGAPVAIAVSAVNALITLAVAWSDIDRGALLIWAGAVLALAFVRMGLWLRHRMIGASARNLSQFARAHVALMGLNGAMWGALAPIFAVHGMIGNAFLPFVIAGTAAGAIVSSGASWRAVLAFNIPALAPLAVVYAAMGGPDGAAVAGVVMLFCMATAYLGFATQRMIDRSILLHTKNDKLFSALQKQADDAHEAEQRFRALVEASLEVTVIFSPEGRVTYASPSVERALGVKADALVGRTTKDIVHPDDMAVFRAVGERSLSQLGEVMALPHICMRAPDAADYAVLSGRLTNMLYVPGVEGFVFAGAVRDSAGAMRHHAAE